MGGSYAVIEALIINMELNNKYMAGAYLRALALTAIGVELISPEQSGKVR